MPEEENNEEGKNGAGITPELLLKRLKANLARKLNAGEVGLANEIDRVRALEKSIQKEKSGSPPSEDEDAGIPERLRVKRRPYTLSPAALEARRQNAQKSSGPVTEAGKAASARNAWRHGLYAQSFQSLLSPCKSTCERYPCDLVEDGATSPGENCLDRQHFVEAAVAIEKAMMSKDPADFERLAVAELASNLDILRRLKEEIVTSGVLLKSEKIDREGNVIGYEYKLNPVLLALPKLNADLGLTFGDFLLTPRSKARADVEEDGINSMAELFGSINKKLQGAPKKEISGV